MERSGGIITSAAAIVILVSLSFASADMVLVKALWASEWPLLCSWMPRWCAGCSYRQLCACSATSIGGGRRHFLACSRPRSIAGRGDKVAVPGEGEQRPKEASAAGGLPVRGKLRTCSVRKWQPRAAAVGRAGTPPLVLSLVVAGCGIPGTIASGGQLRAAARATATPSALPPVRFPQDEAPHHDLTEWWYYTGHFQGTDAHGELRITALSWSFFRRCVEISPPTTPLTSP